MHYQDCQRKHRHQPGVGTKDRRGEAMEKVASFSLTQNRYIFLDWERKVDKNKLNGLIKVWALVDYRSVKDGISLPSGEDKCALHLIANKA